MRRTLIAIVVIATGILSLASTSGQTLTIKVSDTLLGLNQKWAEAYTAKHPGAAIHVTSEATAATFATLAKKKADIVVVPRAMRYKEVQPCEAAFGRRPAEFKVAVSGLSVFVNTNNPVKVLTYDELFAIFQGKSQNWKEFDGGKDKAISVYAQATNSVNGELFNEEVLNGRGFAAESHLLTGPEVLKAVAADPNGIGIAPLVPFPCVESLSIKRVYSSRPVKPSADNISHRIYPISRYVYSYVNPAANLDEIKAYIDWIRSDEGQQVAKEAGFYALPAILRSSQ
jgi:phosphate transport system substrate-binding protein